MQEGWVQLRALPPDAATNAAPAVTPPTGGGRFTATFSLCTIIATNRKEALAEKLWALVPALLFLLVALIMDKKSNCKKPLASSKRCQ